MSDLIDTTVIALVGRPNVGKSTLFNALTKTRDALVADYAGLTRDRKYGIGKVGPRGYMVVDTGGLSGEDEGIDEPMAEQTWQAIVESSAIVFLVDGRDGISSSDSVIADRLRELGKPVFLVVNKIDGMDAEQARSDFFGLGFGEPFPVAAAHGRGVQYLMEQILGQLPEQEGDIHLLEKPKYDGIGIAFIGRPNVGKSTLVNRILGEDRVVAFDQPGTTRDSIFIPFERDEQVYTLIDTAGVRRRARVNLTVEKFSIVKSLKAIEVADVVIAVLDAHENVAEQDAHLLGLCLQAGRPLVIAINKWDGLDASDREEVKRLIDVKLPFIDFAEKHFISALHGSGVGLLFEAVQRAYESSRVEASANKMTKLLEDAVYRHQPPLVRGRRIKLRYAHLGGSNPPVVVIHGNQTKSVPGSYKRYLMNYYRKALQLVGTPIHLEFKTGDNPFAGKKNQLSERQAKKRQRMMKHIKKNKK